MRRASDGEEIKAREMDGKQDLESETVEEEAYNTLIQNGQYRVYVFILGSFEL
jgi:hypothetical protein